MKLTLNKACDLNSISVLPPGSRRGNGLQTGSETSIFAKSQASSCRLGNSHVPPPPPAISQSQGMPLSQLSQSSLDDLVANEQRLCSQERDNSVKRISCLAPVPYVTEDPQLQTRSSNNMLRWNPGRPPDYRFSEEIERRLGTMDTTLHRLGMILDSVQGDVMQINRIVKEVSLELGEVRQKTKVQDDALQQVLKEEEAIKSSLEGTMRSIPDQLKGVCDSNQTNLQEIATTLTDIPHLIEACFCKLKDELNFAFIKEIKEIKKTEEFSPTLEPPFLNSNLLPREKNICRNAAGPKMQPSRREKCVLSSLKTEETKWSRPAKRITTSSNKKVKEEKPSSCCLAVQESWEILIDSDDDLDTGFPGCFVQKETVKTGRCFIEEADEETRQILRRARRRKRRHESSTNYKPCLIA